MRTNIILNDELLGEAMKYSLATSKRAVVEEALATYVSVKEAEEKAASYSERLQRVRSKLSRVKVNESAVDIIRRDRERTS